MSARLSSRKRFALALSLLLALVPVAYAAQAGGEPAEMRFACAKKDGGLLRYVKRAGECKSSTERLIRFRDDRVVACAHQGGYVYLVGKRAACKRERHDPSLTLRLPSGMPNSFCADKKSGLLRSTRHVPYDDVRPRARLFTSACRRDEKRVFVAQRNRRPRAERDTATVGEDAAASIMVLANDSDPEDDPLEVARVFPRDIRGTVAIAADRGSVTYDPNRQFEALGAGASATEVFRYKATDGDRRSRRARVTVTVQGVNDAPGAAADVGGTDEDTATTIAVLGNDSDIDAGDVLSVSGVDTTGTAGAVTVNPNGTLRYDPAGRLDDLSLGEQRIDRFAYTVSDGHGGSASATVSVSVTGANDAPVVTPSAGSTGYAENGPAVVVDGSLTVTDPDDANLEGATVEILGAQPDDELLFAHQNGITGTYVAGVLTLTGTASVANYQTALRSIEFDHAGDDPPASRSVEFTVSDGSLDSATAVRTISITGPDDPPVAVDDSATLAEDAAATAIDVLANDTDVDGGPTSIASASDPANGTVMLTGGSLGTHTGLTYEPDLNYCNDPPTTTETFAYTLNGGSTATVSVTVDCTPDDPSVGNSAGTTDYAENDPATAIDPAVTVSDVDPGATIAGATVEITGNYAGAQDILALSGSHPGITPSASGDTLTLSGLASPAAYQAALRDVTYRNSSDDPSTALRTVTFTVTDDTSRTGSDTKGVTVGAADDAPVAVDDSATVAEDAAATAIDVLANDTDVDGGPTSIASVNQPANGTVVITGGGTGLTYEPDPNYCNDPPGTSPDTFTYTLNGGSTATVSVTVTCANDAPVVTASPGDTPYTEGGPEPAVDSGLTVTDADDAELEGATVAIVAPQTGDVLGFVDTAEIDGDFAAGVLTLTGTATLAQYQTALRSIEFSTTNDDPATSKSVEFTVDDGDDESAPAVKGIAITPVNDAPVVTTSGGDTAYTEGGPAAVVDNGLTVTDADDTNLEGATVSIVGGGFQSGDALGFVDQNGISGSYDAGTGVLALTGAATVAQYQTALRSIEFSTTHDNPATSKSVQFVIDDGDDSSAPATKTIAVTRVNDAPVVTTSGGDTTYAEGGSAATVDSALTVTDADDASLEGATVEIVSGFDSGDSLTFVDQNGISGSYGAGTGVLTLTGTASVADYQAALRSIEFSTTNENPATSKSVRFVADDGDADSAPAIKSIAVTRDDDAPVAVDDSATVGEDAAATAIPVLTNDTDVDGGPKSVASASDPANGTVVITGGGAGLTYQPDPDYCNDPPGTAPDTFTYTLNGGSTATVSVTVTCANDAPVVVTSGGDTAYTEGGPEPAVDSGLTVSDVDDANLEGATVEIVSGFQSGDVLDFVDQLGIAGSYDTGTGVLTLTGTASVSDYQTALRSIEFSTTNDDPATSKSVEFTVDDGDDESAPAVKGIAITPVNDAPVVTTSGGDTAYTEGGPAAVVDNGLTVTDADDAELEGATVAIVAPQTGDVLGFVDQNGISGSYDGGTGVLVLTGAATVAQYQTALRSIEFSTTHENPATSKSVQFVAGDGDASSAPATKSIAVTPVNDAPVVTTSGGNTAYTEDGPAAAVDSGLTVSDVDDADLEGATVAIVSGFDSGDALGFVDQLGIAGSYDTGTGVLTLTGTASVSDYQTALRSIEFSTTNDDPATSKSVQFTADDGDADSAPAIKVIAVTRVNDAPVLDTTNSALAYPEDAGPVAADPGITVTDPDSTQIQGATVQITSGFAAADDELAFADQLGITGSYDDGTGTLTLSGDASVADYQAALRAVTYENSSQNLTGTRILTFEATDAEGDTGAGTRDITLGAANDAATITTTATPLAYTEGAPATAVDDGLTVADLDDTNLEGAQVRISAGFEPGDELLFTNQNGISGAFAAGTGVLTLTGTSSLANYQTALRSVEYRHTGDNPTPTKTVEFRADDGDGLGPASTRNIDVSTSDDAPVAVDDSATAAEDAAAGAVDVLANDTDVDGGPKSIASVTQPANGTVVITGGGTGLTYEPDPNYCNDPPGTTPDTFTYTLNGGSTATVSVTVTCADDAPTAVDDSATVVEDAPASAIPVLTNDTDIDGGPRTIGSTSDPANGAVVITGGGTGLTYEPDPNYCNDPPGTTPDTFTYTLNGGSTATVSVTVTCAEDAPIAVDDDATLDEDSSATAIDVLANDTDADGGPKSISSTSDPANGAVVITGGGTGLTYQPDPNYCNNHAGGSPDTFTYSLNGGSTATVSVTVDCLPDDPSVDNSAGSTSYTENAPATAIDPAVTVTDPDLGATIAEATVQISGGLSEDILALSGSHAGITPSVSGDTLTLTGPASVAAFQAALRDVTYRNSSDNPSTAPRTVTFMVDDGASGTASDTKGVTVVAVDDPPTAVNDSPTVLEDAAATAIPVLTNDTDVDGGPKSISSATDPANGTVVVTGGGTGLTYQPDPNYCNDPPGTTPDTFNYTLNGGSSATVSMTVTCVNDAPVADDETFNGNDSAHGNTAMVVNDPTDGAPSPLHPKTTVSGDILAGDTDIDGPGPLTVTPGTFATNDPGGSVTIESDGDFTFHPAPSTSCTDTSDFFDYTVSDQNAAGPGPAPGTDTGRVTIAIAGCVWYVSNNAAGNSGTSAAPFDTLGQAEALSGNNHTVFVFDGDNTTTGLDSGGYQMNSGERLIGEHEGLVVDPDGGGALTSDTLHPANAGAHPTLTSSINTDVIDLDDGNEIRGLNVDPQGTGGGIAGLAGDTGGGTIDDVNVVDTVGTAGQQAGLELNGTTGTFNVSNFTVNNNATGVLLNNAGTTDFGSTTITSNGGPGLSATGTNMNTSQFDSITSSNSATGGVNLDGTTNTTVLGDGTGTDLSLTTTSGSQPAFRLNNAGSVTVGGAGTDNVSATGGPAVDVTGTSGITLDFDEVDSTNSTADGINIAGLGAGTFTADNTSSIVNAGGIDFDLDGGSGAITYNGTISDDVGQLVRVANTGGGLKDFNGNISDGGDGDGSGISLTANNAATTMRFDGGLTLSTGANPAFTATGGGTIAVTDPAGATNNTLATGTGTALNIANTNIHGDRATFQSISANGAANGIVLNNTGASGGLTVTGGGSTAQGGDNSGGTIQTTGHGISLTNTTGPSFRNMRLQNTGDSGVNGTQVSGFSFTDGTITGAGDASDENSITFDDSLTGSNVSGVVTVTNNVISQTEASGVEIENGAGTISDANISNNAISDTGEITNSGSAVLLVGRGSAATTAQLTKATLSNNVISNFNSGAGFTVQANNVAGGPAATMGIAGSATNKVVVNNNRMAGGNLGVGNQPDRFITSGINGAGQANVEVTNNGTAADRIRNIDCIAIELQADGPATMTSTVQNNFINPNSAVGCAGIAVGTDDPQNRGAGTHSTLISGNNVMGTDGPGIFPIVRDSGSTMTARVINNTVAAPITTNSPRAGIRVDSGSTEGDTTMCLEISGNTTAGSTNTGTATTSPGINLRKQGVDPAVNTFGIEGMAATASPGVENYVNGLNTSTSGTFGTGGTALLSAAAGFTNCNAP